MRKYTRLLIVMIFAVSCKDYDISLPITYNLVKEIKAYDLDNNGNSSDIRIEFKVENNHNVSEYRVIVLPADLNEIYGCKVIFREGITIPRIEVETTIIKTVEL